MNLYNNIARIYKRNIALRIARIYKPINKPKGRHRPRIAYTVYPDRTMDFNAYWRYIYAEANATHGIHKGIE
jgi:hypothetical protein